MKKLYIGNLARRTTEKDLEATVAAFGKVNGVAIIKDRYTGDSRGFAFVEMENDAEAQAAIAGLNGRELAGRKLTVNEARPMESRPANRNRGGSDAFGRRSSDPEM
jgi:cold-inducible RNA-binding protein